jgi:hypothetical protein
MATAFDMVSEVRAKANERGLHPYKLFTLFGKKTELISWPWPQREKGTGEYHVHIMVREPGDPNTMKELDLGDMQSTWWDVFINV